MMQAAGGIADVAREAGVSTSTVSRVLLGQPGVSTATRMRVREVASRLGYVRDARGRDLTSSARFTVGVFVRAAALSFYGELLALTQEALEADGARVVMASGSRSDPSSTRELADLLGQRPDAVLVASGRFDDEVLSAVAGWAPTTLIGRAVPHLMHVASVADDGAGVRELALLVAAAGHRRVGVVDVPAARSRTLHPRSDAMATELDRVGVQVHRISLAAAGDRPDEAALDAALAGESGVTAIMAPSDPVAVATWEELALRGLRVPEDVSLTGYDGIGQLSTPILGLTTWRQPLEAMAQFAAEALRDGVRGRVPEHRRVRGDLVRGRTLAEHRGS